jgi:LmbE family N-acetylglucosaminyl deacetylase
MAHRFLHSDITHPDHGMLHRAYVDVMTQYPNKNVTFYFYEDYPYVARFNKEQPITLEKNLENDTNRLFDRVDIPLSNAEVRQKQKSLEAYPSQIKAFDALQFDVVTADIDYTDARCGPGNACEVVYKLFIAP